MSISDDFVAVLFPGFLNLEVVVWADFMVSGRQGEFCNALFFPPTAEFPVHHRIQSVYRASKIRRSHLANLGVQLDMVFQAFEDLVSFRARFF